MAREITVGIDIGTSSVKAVAADADGNVVASSRVPHEIQIPAPDRFQHDAGSAWRDGPVAALAALHLDAPPDAVSVAAMVPSLTAVDGDGVPCTPGLLYGDGRGRSETGGGNPIESRELIQFLRWTHEQRPDAAGYWPATAVANHALSGEAVLDSSTASTAFPLFDWTSWDPEVAGSLGVRVEQLPRLVPTAWECGRVGGADGPVLASGCIDALADQIVAGADNDGDVLVLLGTTLIVNSVTTSHDPIDGYWVIPHTAKDKFLAGGPSNAGGLFVNWATAALHDPEAGDLADPGRVPVWAPYPRGERVPLHDPDRRAVLADLDLTHGPAALRRAAFEASGFVARRTIEAATSTHGIHAAADHRDRWGNPGRRMGAGARRLHRPPGRVHRGARGCGARLGLPGPLRVRAGARRHAGRSPLGPARAHGRSRFGLGRAGRRPIPSLSRPLRRRI